MGTMIVVEATDSVRYSVVEVCGNECRFEGSVVCRVVVIVDGIVLGTVWL